MLAPETLLQNRYRIVGPLGEGGMGTVYEAIDERLDSTVALKETKFTDERLRKQFEREARLLARLRHPAMTKVIDHFNEGEGQYLVMEFIPGDDLWAMMKQRTAPFSPEEVLCWGEQLSDALDYLHTQDPQIIHRDIKPQNLKLTGRGQIILLDFGLAKGCDQPASQGTTTGSIFGYTPNYAPLEQIQGMGTDPRSDLYSLAATLYHLLTGVAPPDALTRITAVANEEPDPLRPANELNPHVSPALAAVLINGLSQNREKRPANAARMNQLLHATRTANGSDTGESTSTVPCDDDTASTLSPSQVIAIDISEMPTVSDIAQKPVVPLRASATDASHAAGTPSETPPVSLAPTPKVKWMRWAVGGVLMLLLVGVSIALLANRSPRQEAKQRTTVPGGTKLGRPLRVGIVAWPGYAGGIVANNGFKPNQNCIFWKYHELEVEFVLIEDVRARNESFMQGGEGGIDLMWSTVDSLARDVPVLKDKGIEARAIMQVDWSRGGDAIVADQGIKRIEDLKGKKISLGLFTPSHWLLEHSLENSSLAENDQAEIVKSLVERSGSPEALTDFLGKQVDVAVLWEPDISDALKQRPGAHVLVSTKTDDNLIADILVGREDFITAHPEVIKDFVQAWLEGTKQAYFYPDYAIDLLMATNFTYKKQGVQTTRAMYQAVKLADITDNTKMFGLDGNEPLFDQIFKQASQAWAKRGYINRPASPEQAKTVSFLKNIYAAAPATKSLVE